ncbi:MAG: adenosyl-hopene transferase HpnH [Bdellovibrionales bacterium]|nr:adenosyl-hopene transferase HpnH [Bdellovibrionales bacterium]
MDQVENEKIADDCVGSCYILGSMPIPLKQVVKVGAYVSHQQLKKREKFPLVLMLEPLFRCNLECAGCGKIQFPEEILKKHLSPEQCFQAAKECGAPVVSIAGGEPLIHPQIEEITQGLIDRKKFVYLCTNAILLERKLDGFSPSDYLTFSVHMDGLKKRHDELVCRDGVFDKAISAISAAKKRGFRVTTNTTVFDGEKPEDLADLFDYLMDLGVDGMMISPGYSYEKAPDQKHFLQREKTAQLFEAVFREGEKRGRKWPFNHSPFFLDFLEGKIDYDCTPWGNPNYSVFGWQKPCYLFSEGYVQSFKELIEDTPWEKYGHRSQNPKCKDCMVHCGYEPTAVKDSTRTASNALRSLVSALR